MNWPERKLPRLQSYDYALPGAYFVTICVADRMPRFGEVAEGCFEPIPAGQMVADHWEALPERYAYVEIDAYVVMPNHFHGLLLINAMDSDRRRSLSAIVGAFKSLTSRAYAAGVRDAGWPPFERRLWQHSFYDHIVRDDRDLNRIRNYIANNPARWHDDREYIAWQSALQQRQPNQATQTE